MMYRQGSEEKTIVVGRRISPLVCLWGVDVLVCSWSQVRHIAVLGLPAFLRTPCAFPLGWISFSVSHIYLSDTLVGHSLQVNR